MIENPQNAAIASVLAGQRIANQERRPPMTMGQVPLIGADQEPPPEEAQNPDDVNGKTVQGAQLRWLPDLETGLCVLNITAPNFETDIPFTPDQVTDMVNLGHKCAAYVRKEKPTHDKNQTRLILPPGVKRPAGERPPVLKSAIGQQGNSGRKR